MTRCRRDTEKLRQVKELSPCHQRRRRFSFRPQYSSRASLPLLLGDRRTKQLCLKRLELGLSLLSQLSQAGEALLDGQAGVTHDPGGLILIRRSTALAIRAEA